MPIQINNVNAIDDNRNFSAAGITTIGSGSTAITINGSTSVVNIGTGITLSGSTGSISISGTIFASSLNVPIEISSFDPAIGSTSVGISSNIILNFNQTVGLGTTGFFEIKTGLNTTGGTLVERVGIGSTRVTISNGGRRLTVDPTSNFGFTSSFYVTMSSGFVVANGSNFTGINTVGTSQTYYFTSKGVNPGDDFGGGRLLCQSAGVRWILAPSSSEVYRQWNVRTDADTRAQTVSGCTGWFVPSCSQLQNPGYVCRVHWDSISTFAPDASGFKGYWSNSTNPFGSVMIYLTVDSFSACPATVGAFVRSFRCVTY